MSEYRRYYQYGGHYFFTLVTYQRLPIFANRDHVRNLNTAINKVRVKHPFSLNALVILPDHLHCLWKLPEHDHDFSKRWRLIKRYFSIGMNAETNARSEKEIWQRRFWEHMIRDENDWRKHMDYIHYNPVKHQLVQTPKDWPHSSFDYWVKRGLYEQNWGAGTPLTFTGIVEAE